MGVPVLLFPSQQKGPPAGEIAYFFTIILKIGSMILGGKARKNRDMASSMFNKVTKFRKVYYITA